MGAGTVWVPVMYCTAKEPGADLGDDVVGVDNGYENERNEDHALARRHSGNRRLVDLHSK